MNISGFGRVVLCGAISSILALPASASLLGYWPLDEVPGNGFAPNLVVGGPAAFLYNTAVFAQDPERGAVLQFSGAGGYAEAGSIPAMTLESDFTWSFWSWNDELAPSNNTILGNRYDFNDGENIPREFIKFTNQQFEFHHNEVGENIDYVNMPIGGWIHNTVVKDGNTLISYRNGLINGVRIVTAVPINSQPLFFGGDRMRENWSGKLDDVAIWTDALPMSSVVGLAKGTVNPQTARTTVAPTSYTTVFSDDFSGGVEGKWNVTSRGLENNGEAGYLMPDTTGGTVTLGGFAGAQYWHGRSIESQERFSSSVQTKVSVDRVSISGSGTAYRSSIWIFGDDDHYLHFSQNVGETGWSWNARDINGVGTLNDIGAGNNIPSLDALDNSFGSYKLQLEIVPTGVPGEINILMYVDGTLVAGHGFSAFPESFQVVLTGQARALGDTVDAVFDNVLVQQVPEPSTALLLLGGVLAACGRRRGRVG